MDKETLIKELKALILEHCTGVFKEGSQALEECLADYIISRESPTYAKR